MYFRCQKLVFASYNFCDTFNICSSFICVYNKDEMCSQINGLYILQKSCVLPFDSTQDMIYYSICFNLTTELYLQLILILRKY